MDANDGRFELFATYPICFWSGKLGQTVDSGQIREWRRPVGRVSSAPSWPLFPA
jgi:hypothetical protein